MDGLSSCIGRGVLAHSLPARIYYILDRDILTYLGEKCKREVGEGAKAPEAKELASEGRLRIVAAPVLPW
jgi:uncharacterized protein involved in copper resistance